MSDVLAEVRAALRGSAERRHAAVASRFAARRDRSAAAPACISEDVLGQFRAQAQAASCMIESVSSAQQIAPALDVALGRWSARRRVVVAPDPLLRSWLGACATLDVRFGPATTADSVGVMLPVAAVAETGTLVFHSGPGCPTSLAFLPDYFVAVVPHSRVVPTYEAALEQLPRGTSGEAMPRRICLVTGPSRTADIEEMLLLGAHGPRTVLLIMVEGL